MKRMVIFVTTLLEQDGEALSRVQEFETTHNNYRLWKFHNEKIKISDLVVKYSLHIVSQF